MSVVCPICVSDKPEIFWKEVWGEPGSEVLRCPDCDLYFLTERREGDIQQSFDKNYDKYIAARAEVVVPCAKTDFKEMVSESIAERFRDIGDYFVENGSLLEIGAERGEFLDRIRGRMGRLTAVDSCPEYLEVLKEKGFSAFSYVTELPTEARYDSICMFSLLEHIQEPVSFLKELVMRLAPEGRMIIEVPSAEEPLVSLYDIPAFKSFYFQGMHPFVYSLKSLEILMGKVGLKVSSVRYKQRYGLANHLQWLRSGVPGGSKELSKIFSTKSDAVYREALESAGRTDTLYLIASRLSESSSS